LFSIAGRSVRAFVSSSCHDGFGRTHPASTIFIIIIVIIIAIIVFITSLDCI
jgi:hypothetical protein